MKKFFTYFSGVIYSAKQCMLTWKMPKLFPILTFIISFIMLLTPIQYSYVSTPTSTVLKQIPNIEEVLSEVAKNLNSKKIDVAIENNVLTSSNKYQEQIEGYTIFIDCDISEYSEVHENKANPLDSIIVFNEKDFYARYVERDSNNNLLKEQVLAGSYNKLNKFSFNDIYECENEQELNVIVGTLVKNIYLSNSSYHLLTWSIIVEIFNLLFILIGGFILLYANKKGNRDYKITYGQSFLTIMSSIALPSLMATIVGMFSFSFFTIIYVIFALIRLMRLCYVQISRDIKYNQIESNEDPDDYQLKLKR